MAVSMGLVNSNYPNYNLTQGDDYFARGYARMYQALNSNSVFDQNSYNQNLINYGQLRNAPVTIDGETCTDGKDDGKIGLGSTIWNLGKGVVKTAWNGAKSLVTDSEGNFSLWQTVKSAATIGVCIAVPWVGVAACAVGGTMAAIKVGKGVYDAATAKTDAEAKAAWQQVGGGALTTGLSILGAKASFGAMKTAAAANTAAGGSALAKLPQNATLIERATGFTKAFVTDAYRSTTQNFHQLGNTFKSIAAKGAGEKAVAQESRYLRSLHKGAKLSESGKAKIQAENSISALEKLSTEIGEDATFAQKAGAFMTDTANATRHAVTSQFRAAGSVGKAVWDGGKAVVQSDNHFGTLTSQIGNQISKIPNSSLAKYGSYAIVLDSI